MDNENLRAHRKSRGEGKARRRRRDGRVARASSSAFCALPSLSDEVVCSCAFSCRPPDSPVVAVHCKIERSVGDSVVVSSLLVVFCHFEGL